MVRLSLLLLLSLPLVALATRESISLPEGDTLLSSYEGEDHSALISDLSAGDPTVNRDHEQDAKEAQMAAGLFSHLSTSSSSSSDNVDNNDNDNDDDEDEDGDNESFVSVSSSSSSKKSPSKKAKNCYALYKGGRSSCRRSGRAKCTRRCDSDRCKLRCYRRHKASCYRRVRKGVAKCITSKSSSSASSSSKSYTLKNWLKRLGAYDYGMGAAPGFSPPPPHSWRKADFGPFPYVGHPGYGRFAQANPYAVMHPMFNAAYGTAPAHPFFGGGLAPIYGGVHPALAAAASYGAYGAPYGVFPHPLANPMFGAAPWHPAFNPFVAAGKPQIKLQRDSDSN